MAPSMEAIAQSLVHLSQEKNVASREQLLRIGLNEMVKWFTLAAQIILQKKVQLPKQTLNFMEKHRHELEQLQDDNIDLDTKRQLILKPDGSGFLGGVMIRSLLRWNGKKTIRKFGPKKTTKKTAKKTAKKTTKKTTKKAGKKAYVAHKTPVLSPLTPGSRPSTPIHSSPRRSSLSGKFGPKKTTKKTAKKTTKKTAKKTTKKTGKKAYVAHKTPILSPLTPGSRPSTPIHSSPRRSSLSGVNFTPIHGTRSLSSSRRTSSSRRSLTESSLRSSLSGNISTRPYSFTGSTSSSSRRNVTDSISRHSTPIFSS
ncbi:hypothetical protein ACF0H5_009338 [Mactra antiquata]